MSMSISAMSEKQLEGCSGTANGYGDSNTRRQSQETIADPENGCQSDTKLPDVPPDGGYGVSKIPFLLLFYISSIDTSTHVRNERLE